MASPKIVLMTGSSAGVGLVTAERLAKDPDKRFLVIATVISFDEQDDLVATVGDALDKTVFIRELDVTKDGEIQKVVDAVIQQHGRIDVLLNIAGIGLTGLVENGSRDQLELTFNINTFGVIRLTQAVLPHMKRRKAGKIITVTSLAGIIGLPFTAVYASSKFATEGFMESIAPICRQHNIRVSMLEPGSINTRLIDVLYRSVEDVVADEGVDDLDRRFAREWLDYMKSHDLMEPTVIADTIREIIDVEKPVLRYQVPADMVAGTAAEEAYGDLTGEKLVKMRFIAIGVKESE